MSSIGENAEDRLSMLPEEILSHILSLMPTKYAVRSSVLSRSWRSIWMFVTSIDFNDINPHTIHDYDNFSKFVDRVLDSCKASQLQSLCLLFSYTFLRKGVSSWIDKAVKLNVRELDVQLNDFELPVSLFTCKTLTKLRVELEGIGWLVWEYPCPYPCLKTLDIVVGENCFVNAFLLVHGCPMLETLSMDVEICKEDENYEFNLPTLKRLKLTFHRIDIINKVVLNVPNLEYLFVVGELYSSFVMEDMSSLVEVSFSFHNIIASDHLCVEFLKGISGVKSLSIDKFPCISDELPIFPNMKRLEFKSFCYSRRVFKYLERCPKLEHLCIEKLIVQYPIEPKLVPSCMLTSLTTIKISNCLGTNSEMEFLKYVVGNVEVLKTLTVTLEMYGIEDEKRLCAQFPQLPRASGFCEVHLIRGKRYKASS